ncbi:hypothetical protein [Curtobacterium flaccumfaciens]|uniref:hypothetical protein n=1 Tax=Curtobacterium flaccumfaciens TaxID=2035 RepID=UPI003D9A29DC
MGLPMVTLGAYAAFALEETTTAPVKDMSPFWATAANVALVLGFALVAEVRFVARSWKYEDRTRRAASAILYSVLGVVLVIILNVSLVALIDSKVPTWSPVVVLNLLCAAGAILIANPIVAVATAGNADLFVLARSVWPLLQRHRILRHVKGQRRRVQRYARRALRELRQWRARRDALDKLDEGEALSPNEWRALMRQLYRTSRMSRKVASRIPLRWASLGQYRVKLRDHFDTELGKKRGRFQRISSIRREVRTLQLEIKTRFSDIFGEDFEKEVRDYYDRARELID